MTSTVVSTVNISDGLQTTLRDAFLAFYRETYKGWTEEQLGFPPSELDTWLRKQFAENVGDWFLLLNRDNKCQTVPFLAFSTGETHIDVHQLVAGAAEAIDLLRALAQLYPNRPFYGVIRKENKERIEFFKQHGCNVVVNRFPSYSSVYYCGIEMPPEAVRLLTKKQE